MRNQLYKPNAEKVAAEIIEDEAIIINVATGNYYNTEGIGGWVWQQCVDGKSLDEIAAHAQLRFDVDARQIAGDLLSFFMSLEEEELVTGTQAEVPPAKIELEPAALKLAYKAPRLVAYRDLRDLLALDPPMPRLGADAAAGASPSHPR